VTLKSARGLMPVGLAERVSGCQARLLVPGHSTAISGVVARARDQEGVEWEHEEQFTEVGVLVYTIHSLLLHSKGQCYVCGGGEIAFMFHNK
jgi:hypothetical protein